MKHSSLFLGRTRIQLQKRKKKQRVNTNVIETKYAHDLEMKNRTKTQLPTKYYENHAYILLQ